MWRSAPLLAFGLLSGCFAGEAVRPAVPADAKTVAFLQGVGTPEARAVFLEPGALVPTLEDGPVWALAYDWTPESLVPLGQPVTSAVGGPTQPLPAPLQSLFAAGPDQTFEATPLPEDLLEGFRLPLPDPIACVDAGGCILQDAPTRCQAPCTTSTPVDPPARVAFTCPAGWLATVGPGASLVCAPPTHARRACAEDAWQGGGPDCAPLAECPGGRWPRTPPGAGAVYYLDPAATPGGNGTEAAPFDTVHDLGGLPDGATVLLAAGDLQGSVQIMTSNLHIVGRCPSETRWSTDAPIVVGGDGVRISGLSVRTSSDAFDVRPGARLTLDGLSVEAAGVAARVVSGALEATRLRARARVGVSAHGSVVALDGVDHRGETLLEARGGRILLRDFGFVGEGAGDEDAVRADGCEGVAIEDGFIAGAFFNGVHTSGPATVLTVEDVHVTGAGADGVLVEPPGAGALEPRVVLSRVLFEGTVRAVRATSPRLTVTDLVARGIRHVALDLRQDDVPSHAQLDQIWVESGGENGVRIGGYQTDQPGVEVVGRDWVVELGALAEDDGSALEVLEHGSLTLTGAVVVAPTRRALQVKCGGAELSDVEVTFGGAGAIVAQPATQLQLHRVAMRGTQGAGYTGQLFGGCAPAGVTMSHVRLEGCADCSTGLELSNSTAFSVDHAHISGFPVAAFVGAGAALSLSSSTLEGNQTGLSLPPGYDLFEVLRGVRLDNARDLDVR